MMKGHELEKTCTEYLECVQSMDGMVKWCTKCNRAGCEKCSYKWALRYVVRWQKPAYWWRTSSHPAVTGTVRFLRAVRLLSYCPYEAHELLSL